MRVNERVFKFELNSIVELKAANSIIPASYNLLANLARNSGMPAVMVHSALNWTITAPLERPLSRNAQKELTILYTAEGIFL